MSNSRLRVLLVPDSTYWVTGTIAKSIAKFNPWVEATIVSGAVIDTIFAEQPELMRNFDLVHFICPYASREWMPRFREIVPCVATHHHVTDWGLIKHNLDADAIIVVSPEWAEDLRTRGADLAKVFCMPYGLDAEKFKPATDSRRSALRRKLGISTEVVVGFFGKNSSNDDDRKGIDVFTEAIRGLAQRLSQLTVLIVGPGWKELQTNLKATGAKCIWLPYVETLEGLAELYNALDFYWVTARIEGGPATLLEAMSSEVCCLTTPVGIAREIVRDGHNAILLPFNDAQSFVERTLLLAGDLSERKRIGCNARETILKEMHVGITSRRVEEVYAKAFANFAVRRKTALQVNVHKIVAEAIDIDRPGDDGPSVPLEGFPQEILRRVRMLELLAWSEHLILYHQQRALGFRMIVHEWLHNPLSPLPARVLLRRFLPLAVVRRLVKLRKPPQPVADYSPTEKA